MLNKTASIEHVILIARALDTLNDKVVFVGGAVAALYVNDPGAPEMRPTKDIDIVVQIASSLELEQLTVRLFKLGFQFAKEEKVMCRFVYNDILVDVMATERIGWAPANPWFKPGFEQAELRKLGDVPIRIMPFPYYLASKFAAFKSRGSDPRTSHDFEDIVYILDNRINAITDIQQADQNVKLFIRDEFIEILNDEEKLEAIRGHLEPATQKARFDRLVKLLTTLVS